MDSKTNGAEDEDSLFLERVLDKLYDFGSGPKQKLKGQKKKKKRKRCDEEEEDEECRESGGCREEETRLQEPQTEETGPGGTGANQVPVVTFQDPRKKLKTKQTPAADKTLVAQTVGKQQSDQQEVLDLEKARLEVHRFGITGYRKEQQRIFEQDRAVMLGARPPKKEYVNYKQLQEQIKEKKQKAKEEVQPELKKKRKQRNQNDRKKPAGSGSGAALTGQVGRFKDGMLILSSKEIQKIKGKRGGWR